METLLYNHECQGFNSYFLLFNSKIVNDEKFYAMMSRAQITHVKLLYCFIVTLKILGSIS